MPSQRRWVCLDLDGTLADSIDCFYRVYLNFLSQFGISGNRAEFETLDGPSLTEITARLKQQYQLPGDAAALARQYRQQLSDAYAQKVVPAEGAQATLVELKRRGYQLMLVTAAEPAAALTFIKRQDWESQFDEFVFGSEVKAAKPATAIYDLALRKAGVPAAEVAAAVEDSPSGVVAAKNSGIFAIGLANRHSPEVLMASGADAVVSKIGDIINVIEARSTDQSEPYEVIALGDIKLCWQPDPATETRIADNTEAIEAIWRRAYQASGEKLLNDDLLNFTTINRHGDTVEVIGAYVEYKHFIAQRERPDLGLGIRPVGVSGFTVLHEGSENYLVLARRGDNVTEYPGFLELVPSGSINRACADSSGNVDYKSMILSEFREETGLPDESVSNVSGSALVYDVAHGVYDIGCRIEVNASRERLSQQFDGSDEYRAPVYVSLAELDQSLAVNRDLMVPTSLALVAAWGQSNKD